MHLGCQIKKHGFGTKLDSLSDFSRTKFRIKFWFPEGVNFPGASPGKILDFKFWL